MLIKTLFSLAILMLTVNSNISAQNIHADSTNFSQQKFDEQIDHFLKKSKNQKTIAWVLLGGGTLLNGVGSNLADNNFPENYNGYQLLSSIGELASLASIPLFFSASKNQNKAHLVDFEKDFHFATSDSMRKIVIQDASEYFSAKAKSNTTTGIVLSALGGGLIIAGIIESGNHRDDDYFFGDLDELIYITGGVVLGAISIPFYIRGANLKRTANVILKTQRIPKSKLTTSSGLSSGPQMVAVGIMIPL